MKPMHPIAQFFVCLFFYYNRFSLVNHIGHGLIDRGLHMVDYFPFNKTGDFQILYPMESI